MRKFKGLLAVCLTSAMVMSAAVPSFAGPADDMMLSGQTNVTNQLSGPSPADQNPVQLPPQEQVIDANLGEAPAETPVVVPQSNVSAQVTLLPEANGLLSAFAMNLVGYDKIGGISYRAYKNYGGYLWWYHDGEPCAVTDQGTVVEAIQVQLSGNAEKEYDVYYAVTTKKNGKLGYAKNGEVAGIIDMGDVVTDIDVQIVPKGAAFPSNGRPAYASAVSTQMNIAANGTTYSGGDGWVSDNHQKYYFVNGQAVTGWQYIDGLKFYFDEYGRLVQDVDSLIGKQSDYIIKVNKALNCATVYAKDGDNGFIIPVKAMLTSVGDDTPIGTFKTPEKYRWQLMINDTYTQYATRITKGFLFHSITYETTREDMLNTEGYNGLGVSRSHGCVRLTCANAKWVYDNCHLGMPVTIYEDLEVASPFDKPDLVKISDNQRWDPTDPKFN